MKKLRYLLSVLLITGILISCNNDDTENQDTAIQEIAGTYYGTITPMMMGIAPITQGEKEIYLTPNNDKSIKLHFMDFQAHPMPFKMSVDIDLKYYKESNGTYRIKGRNGTFRADPPTTIPVDKDSIKNVIGDNIIIPPNGENGMISTVTRVDGTIINQEIELKMTPGGALPPVIINIKATKINNTIMPIPNGKKKL